MAADDRDILRNVFDRAKQFGDGIYEDLDADQIMDDPRLFRRVFDTASSIEAPTFLLHERDIGDMAGGDLSDRVQRVRFTNVFGDSPGQYLAGLRTRRGRPKFTIDTLMEEETDDLISRAMNPRRSATFANQRIVVPYGYKTDAENIVRGLRTDIFPEYRTSQSGIAQLNEETPRRFQGTLNLYTPRYVQDPPKTAVVYDATGAQENPMLASYPPPRRRGRPPSVADINTAVRRTLDQLRENDMMVED